jgi:hypothetical protein
MTDTDPVLFRVHVRGGDVILRKTERKLRGTAYHVQGAMSKMLLHKIDPDPDVVGSERQWRKVGRGAGGSEWVRFFIRPLWDGQTVEDVTEDMVSLLGGQDNQPPEMYVAAYEGRGPAELAAIGGWHHQRRMIVPKDTV